MENDNKKELNVCEEIITKSENKIKEILKEGIKQENIDYLYKLVDIHKDIKNEEYWKAKEEYYMRYRNYEDSYGRRMRDSRGRYMDDIYSRRGVKGTGRGRYRGHDMIDEMAENYSNYEDDKSNFGADESTIKSLDEMLKSVEDFMLHLEENAESEQEVSMIKKTAQRIAKM